MFDLDGVLIDSERAWDRARREVVVETGGRWHEGASEEMLGMSSREWSRFLRDRLGVALEPSEINDRVLQRVLASLERELPLLPGAVAAVQRTAAVWPLGLASSANRPVIDAVLALSGLDACFKATVSGEEVAHGKPAPDVYLAVADELGADPRRSAAIEDSANGLRAAAAAGMAVIAVPNREFPPDRDALGLADLTIESLEELSTSAIEGLAAGSDRREPGDRS